MHRRRRILLVAVALLAVALGAAGLVTRRAAPEAPGARTLYSGSARVVTPSLVDALAVLKGRGCRSLDEGGSAAGCLYRATWDAAGTLTSLEVHPHGLGFGPDGFVLADGRVSASRDIPGLPDQVKFEREVRELVHGFVTIDEGSWILTELKYPWTVRY